jgi:TolB-like protein/Flp pilus assembly protein TadD
MTIWSTEIKELEILYTSTKGRFPELEKELVQLIETKDANVVMLYSRRCLEIIITDLCECELKRPRKTEPLKGIIDKLHREEKVPSNIITSMDHLNSLSAFGTHPKDFDPEQVKPVLNNLAIVIKWYSKYKDTQNISHARAGHEKYESREPVDTREVTHRPKKRLIFLLAGFFLVVAIVVVGALYLFDVVGGGKQTRGPEKSIAIIPFKNDSPDEENVYFLNGIMEEILTNLQAIKDLRVISRTSVEQYRSTTKSIPEIAKELGVNYIVEGSGEKYGNTFNLNVQLIMAADKESHLWAKSYEQEIKEVKDIFSVKRQIAQAIANELKAVITPQEKDLILQIPTDNPLAYDYYLKGKQYRSDLKYNLAIEMYNKAIEQDPQFTLAYLERASLYSVIYFIKGRNYTGNWQNFDNLAKADLEKALILSPNSPEVKLEQANQLYRFDRDHDKALALLDEIKTQMPNNPGFFALRSNILQRKGKWEESLAERQKSILLDPFNSGSYNDLGDTYRLLRRYPEAMECFNKPELLGRNDLSNKKMKFLTILLWKGDVKEALKISDTTISYLSNVADLEYLNYYYYSKEYDKLIPIAVKYEDQWKYHPRALILAQIYFLKGNISFSRQYADSAIAELIPKVKEFPEDERYYSALGYAYAYKGEKKKAIENAQKAAKLKPLKLDAWQGQAMEMNLAKIYTLTGEYDLAMDKIEFLLTIPGDISIPFLKINPMYDKLRDLPRFQKILATEYKTNY